MLPWALGATVACAAIAIAAGIVSFAIPARYRSLSLSFAIGVLLGAAFLHLLPEAASILPLRPLRELLATALAAALACYAFEVLHVPHGAKDRNAPVATLVLASGALHNASDGILIGVAFQADARLGIVVLLAIVAHEIPREMGNFAILVDAGWSRARTVAWSVLCRVPAIAATAAGYAALSSLPAALPYVVAATAGILIYVAAADLMPALRARRDAHRGLAPVGCMVIGALLVGAAAHTWR